MPELKKNVKNQQKYMYYTCIVEIVRFDWYKFTFFATASKLGLGYV